MQDCASNELRCSLRNIVVESCDLEGYVGEVDLTNCRCSGALPHGRGCNNIACSLYGIEEQTTTSPVAVFWAMDFTDAGFNFDDARF